MQPDLLIVRHHASGAAELLARKVSCAVVNAGDGQHEHPTQALLDALTIRRRLGRIEGLVVAICGDVAHSRVARSNIHAVPEAWRRRYGSSRHRPCFPPGSSGWAPKSTATCARDSRAPMW